METRLNSSKNKSNKTKSPLFLKSTKKNSRQKDSELSMLPNTSKKLNSPSSSK